MRVFVDTSAWLAVLDRDDQRHALARRIWAALLEGRHELVTSSYVLVETLALIQRRLGMEAFRVFHTDIHPLVDVIWVEGELHRSAAEQVLTANQRRLSLVDCSSFVVLQAGEADLVFAFDRHFDERGYPCLLSPRIAGTTEG